MMPRFPFEVSLKSMQLFAMSALFVNAFGNDTAERGDLWPAVIQGAD
jgi:hypothetical protein